MRSGRALSSEGPAATTNPSPHKRTTSDRRRMSDGLPEWSDRQITYQLYPRNGAKVSMRKRWESSSLRARAPKRRAAKRRDKELLNEAHRVDGDALGREVARPHLIASPACFVVLNHETRQREISGHAACLHAGSRLHCPNGARRRGNGTRQNCRNQRRH